MEDNFEQKNQEHAESYKVSKLNACLAYGWDFQEETFWDLGSHKLTQRLVHRRTAQNLGDWGKDRWYVMVSPQGNSSSTHTEFLQTGAAYSVLHCLLRWGSCHHIKMLSSLSEHFNW
jgi:hypothetical protein